MYRYKDQYVIDFTDVQHYADVHQVIKDALDFPDYYGCNEDALWDCLRDMVGRKVHIQIKGLGVIEQRFGDEAEALLHIFREFKHYRNDMYVSDITVELVDGDVRIPLQ